LRQSDITFRGHAIQARVCAEDPRAGWLPSTGYVHHYGHLTDDGVRYENGIASGSTVSPYYDSMITKIIATGATRDHAVGVLADALGSLVLHGPTTNVSTLRRILADDDFRTGAVSVNWLEGRGDLVEASDPLPVHAIAAAVAAAIATDEQRSPLPAMWSNTPRPPVCWTVVDEHGAERDVRYLPPSVAGQAFRLFTIDGIEFAVRTLARAESCWRVDVDGTSRLLKVTAASNLSADEGSRVWVNGRDGQTEFRIAPRFVEPNIDSIVGGPTSPMPGTVQSIHVAEGPPVAAGDRLVVVEAMKMEHVIRASADAVVTRVLVEAGQSVDAGRVLVELEETP
jgi:propionyl-CoA carboxylase alpha chain